jgi:endonuclease-3
MPRPRTPAGRARETHRRLALEYPEAVCALDHRNPYELLTATILSAQTTDERVNMVTPALFARYPTPKDLAEADPADVEELIRSTGFYRNKARSIQGMARRLVEVFDGEVPTAMADLVTLPGVGRKTANVVRSVAMGLPGLPVDTHVTRLTRLLGITTETDAVKIEMVLNPMVPAQERGEFSLRLILHGRAVCIARRPRCEICVLNDFCPSSHTRPASSSRSATKQAATDAVGGKSVGRT